MSLVELVRYAEADQQLLRASARFAADQVTARWRALVPFPSDQALDEFAASAADIVDQVAAQTAANTAAFLAGYAELAEQPAPNLERIDLSAAAPAKVRGVASTADVYARPIITVRTEMAGDVPLDEALRIGELRAASTAMTDITLTARAAAQLTLSEMAGVSGYRRVPGPNACPFCLTAAEQNYNVPDLRPIHQRCSCGIAPTYRALDPGDIIASAARKQIAAGRETIESALAASVARARQQLVTASTRRERNRARDRFRTAERRLARHRAEYGTQASIAVRTHGELGPTLTAAGHTHTGPASVR